MPKPATEIFIDRKILNLYLTARVTSARVSVISHRHNNNKSGFDVKIGKTNKTTIVFELPLYYKNLRCAWQKYNSFLSVLKYWYNTGIDGAMILMQQFALQAFFYVQVLTFVEY